MANRRNTAEEAAQATDTASTEATGAATPAEALHALVVGLPDGEVTFTRPGVESYTFTVKDGTISTTKERYDWLLRNVTGATPVAD